MPFDFPASPAADQEYTPAGGPTYVFKPPVWKRKATPAGGGGGGAATTVGDEAPASPVVGQLWYESDTGNTFIWYDDGNTQQWVQVNIPAYMLEDYLSKSGGTLTGDLAISKASPVLNLTKPAAGTTTAILSATGAANRWRMFLGNQEAESGGNAGSNFGIDAFNDAGAYLSTPLRIDRATGLTTMAGDLAINKVGGTLTLNNGAYVQVSNAGNPSLQAITSNSAGVPFLLLQNPSGYWQVRNEGAAGDLTFLNGGSTYATIKRAGGALALPFGQIVFPPTQNPLTDPYTLDDYRERQSWVPTLYFGAGGVTGITYGTRQGRFLKVGNTVYFWCWIALTAKGTSTGAAALGSLPYVPESGAMSYYPASLAYSNLIGALTVPNAMVIAGASAMNLYNGSGTLTDANFNNATSLGISGSYEVA